MFGFSVNIFFASETFFSLMARRSLIARIYQRERIMWSASLWHIGYWDTWVRIRCYSMIIMILCLYQIDENVLFNNIVMF